MIRNTLILLMIGFGQFAFGQYNLSSWQGYDAAIHDGAKVPRSAIAKQINGNIISNCHGYSFYQVLGIPLPTAYPTEVDVQHLYDTGIIKAAKTYTEATHVVWFKPWNGPGVPPVRAVDDFTDAVHSAVLSQFDAFPKAQRYCHSPNGMSPGHIVHKIEDYEPTGNYDVVFYKVTKPIILPDYQPVTPASIFSCGAFISQPVCGGRANGELSVVHSTSGLGSTYSYNWSNGSHSLINSNVSTGTYTVTVTEAPSNYTCISSVYLQSSLVDRISYVQNNSLYRCNGTATVHATNGQPSAFTYNWSANTGNQSMATATGLCSGTYGVKVTLNSTGCSEIHSITIPNSGSFTFKKADVTKELAELNTPSEVQINYNIKERIIAINGLENKAYLGALYNFNGALLFQSSFSPIGNSRIIQVNVPNAGYYIYSLYDEKGELIQTKKMFFE